MWLCSACVALDPSTFAPEPSDPDAHTPIEEMPTLPMARREDDASDERRIDRAHRSGIRITIATSTLVVILTTLLQLCGR